MQVSGLSLRRIVANAVFLSFAVLNVLCGYQLQQRVAQLQGNVHGKSRMSVVQDVHKLESVEESASGMLWEAESHEAVETSEEDVIAEGHTVHRAEVPGVAGDVTIVLEPLKQGLEGNDWMDVVAWDAVSVDPTTALALATVPPVLEWRPQHA
ncbi:hypothetical protein CYMTET_39039 [Cymbomonas tetramitiformis]|uniref:Uncharacterized protein n=1 Tax=Cymbomonas tetramitiformis TaxID=36881 RepID=A0AAE0CAU8_9CHLO|nr:hypothetical protein CYMTET_39039 [Cymbomonas tetramitiformis]